MDTSNVAFTQFQKQIIVLSDSLWKIIVNFLEENKTTENGTFTEEIIFQSVLIILAKTIHCCVKDDSYDVVLSKAFKDILQTLQLYENEKENIKQDIH